MADEKDVALTIVAMLAVVNLTTFIAFAYDKFAAIRGAPRIREKMLLSFAMFGGTPAAFLASHLFRHKTVKQPFRNLLWLILAAQIVLVAAVVFFPASWLALQFKSMFGFGV